MATESSALTSARAPSSTPPSKGHSNPLANKVSSVLSSSYADSEFRDSLALLDENHVQNNAETRRRLRLDIQKEVIESNGEVIAEFGRVAEQLRRIGSTIDALNTTYGNLKAEISAAHDATKPVLDEATGLIDRRRNVETRRRLLNAFVDHFVLSEDEIASLTLTAEPVDAQFFSVLSKAKKISKDCEILLGFEDNPSLGPEIMEQTSKNINLGFQKLYKWVQKEFKHLNLENPQISSSMSRALRVLAERPALFQSYLNTFAEARESILSDAFYTALTGSSENGTEVSSSVKPIELAAHDPLRYAGDMLAWVHSATVSERESLESLFVGDGGELARGIQEGREMEVWRLAAEEGGEDEEAFNPVEALNNLVDRNLSGVSRILRQRMAQAIQVNEDTILAYKLANLLNFYRLTFRKLLSNDTDSGEDTGEVQNDGPSLVDTLKSLETEALRHFRSLIRDHIATLQGEFAQASSDLSPPDFLQDAMKQLISIMKTYETSITSPDSREAGFAPILEEALDPFLEGCESMAEKANTPLENLIFTINCLDSARETLALYDFTTSRTAELQSNVDRKARALVESQYAFFRRRSGLERMFSTMGSLKPESEKDLKTATALELLNPQMLVEVSQCLDDFLPSALVDAIDNLKALQDPQKARQVTEEAAEMFCVDFEHVEAVLDAVDRLRSEGDGSKDPDTALRTLFPRTSVEIRVLLS